MYLKLLVIDNDFPFIVVLKVALAVGCQVVKKLCARVPHKNALMV